MIATCQCPSAHTRARLGHCATCPLFGVSVFAAVPIGTPACALLRCGSTVHADGSDHGFTFATYCDDAQSYSVCRCGAVNAEHPYRVREYESPP
jgi:hypothetical protein